MKRLICLKIMVFVLLGLTACHSSLDTLIFDDTLANTPLADNNGTAVVSVGQKPTVTPSPLVFTATPSATPRATITHAPTRTPVPTPTLRITATPTATTFAIYDVPVWLSQPQNSSMLMFETIGLQDGEHTLIVHNVVSGEQFVIPVGDCCIEHSWLLREDTLYIQLDHPRVETSHTVLQEPYQEFINTKTGEVTQHQPPFPGRYAVLSPNGRHVALIDRNPMRIAILDQEQDKEVALQDLFNGRYSNHYSASCTKDGALLAVSQVTFPEEPGSGSAQYGLAIYTSEGEPFRMYDHINFGQWASVSPYKFLYTTGPWSEIVPCILYVADGNHICLEAITRWREEQDVQVAQFMLSPDGNKVSFIHWNSATNNNGLCYLDLNTDAINCLVTPTDLLSIDKDSRYYVILHHWSPRGDYIAFYVNPNGPLSNDSSFTSIGIVNSDGTHLEILGPVLAPYKTDQLWWELESN